MKINIAIDQSHYSRIKRELTISYVGQLCILLKTGILLEANVSIRGMSEERKQRIRVAQTRFFGANHKLLSKS